MDVFAANVGAFGKRPFNNDVIVGLFGAKEHVPRAIVCPKAPHFGNEWTAMTIEVEVENAHVAVTTGIVAVIDDHDGIVRFPSISHHTKFTGVEMDAGEVGLFDFRCLVEMANGIEKCGILRKFKSTFEQVIGLGKDTIINAGKSPSGTGHFEEPAIGAFGMFSPIEALGCFDLGIGF